MPASSVRFRFTRQLSCTYHSVIRNWPCADGCPSDSVYSVMAPSNAFAKPTFVLRGFEPSALKLKFPLKLDVRAAGRVVCSTKSPAFIVCAPFSFVMLPETLNKVLYPKKGNRCSMLNWSGFPGTPPVNVACGRMYSGLACGKNCGIPGSTTRRSFASRAASSNGLVYWCAQFTPTVNSPCNVGLNVCSSVFT